MSESRTWRQIVRKQLDDELHTERLRFDDRVFHRAARADDLDVEEAFNQAQAEKHIPADAQLDDVAELEEGRDWQEFFTAFGDFIKTIAPILIQLLPFLLSRRARRRA